MQQERDCARLNEIKGGACLTKKLKNMDEVLDDVKSDLYGCMEELESKNQEINNLQNKLATIERIASDRNKWNKE